MPYAATGQPGTPKKNPPWPGKTCVPARPPDSGGWPPPNLRRNWCRLAFHEPKIKRWHSWQSWQLSTTIHNYQHLSTAFHISTDSTEILQGLMPCLAFLALAAALRYGCLGGRRCTSSRRCWRTTIIGMSFLGDLVFPHKTSHETLYMYNISGSL